MEKNEMTAELIFRLIKQITNNYHSYICEKSKGYGYTVPQMILMRQVYLHPEITLRELSERMGLAKSTVSGIVDRLEARNAVMRVRDEVDRRAVKISLAPAMLEYKEGIKLINKSYMAHILEVSSAEDLETILRGLTKLHELLEIQK